MKALGFGKGHLDAMVRIGLTVDIVLQLPCSSVVIVTEIPDIGGCVNLRFPSCLLSNRSFVLALFHSSSYSSELSSSSVSMVGSIAGITKFSSSLLSISPLSCMMVWGGGGAGVSLATRTACGV